MAMLEALLSLIATRASQEKQNFERCLLFWGLKGVLCIMAVVFIAIAMFIWLSHATSMPDLAALLIGCICIFAYALTSFIQRQINRRLLNNKNEWLVITLIAAFIEGMNAEKKCKNTATNSSIN